MWSQKKHRDDAIKDALDYTALWQIGMLARGHIEGGLTGRQEKRAQPRHPDLVPPRKKL